MISILAARFGKSISPRRSYDIIEVVTETVDDLGKVQSITDLLKTNTDSLEGAEFLQCLNSLSFLNSSYSSGVDHCYERALDESNKNNSRFSEVLFKMKKPLGEMKDNHLFNLRLINSIQDGYRVKFDSAWKAHFKKPSQIDLEYKSVLRKIFETRVETKRSLDSLSNRLKEVESLINKENN
jgi:hypothetical protein